LIDPIHGGHLSHIQEAKKLGDWLVAIAGTEEQCRHKHGDTFLSWQEKVDLLKALGADEVVPNIDNNNGSPCSETLRVVRPQIFAKGEGEIVPEVELRVCGEIGCKVIYGVGKRLNRSSKYFKLGRFAKLFVFTYQKFLKFIVVGSTGVVVNFGLTYLLTEQIHLFYLLSSALAVATAATTNYLMNHYWTFREKRANNPNILTGWMKYLVAIGVTELIYLGLMYLFTSVFGLWYMFSAVFALFLTFTIRFFTADRIIWGKKA
jgi:cytidyltransferase-like protein